MINFAGIFPALVTPYTKDQEIDYTQLGNLVEHLNTSGVDGFYVCGSTAEAFLLTPGERKKILETVIEANAGKGKIIAHVGAIGTRLSVDFVKHANEAGADAISSVAPFYYKFDQEEVISYYSELSRNTNLPLFIYNFPSNSGVQLTNGALDTLLALPNVAGIKHTSNDFFQLERIKTKHPNLIVWNGYDEMLLSGLVAGADGGIGSTYNCMPHRILDIYQAYKSHNLEKARTLQQSVNEAVEIMVKYGAFQSVKALLEFQGFGMNGCRSPFKPLSRKALAELVLASV